MVEPLPWPRPRQSPCPMKVDLQGQGSAVLSWTTLGGRSGSLPPPEPPLRAALHQAIMVVLPSASSPSCAAGSAASLAPWPSVSLCCSSLAATSC